MSAAVTTTGPSPSTSGLAPGALATFSAESRWVAWQQEDRPGAKPTKVPYAPGGEKARADDPRTWGTRAAAEGRAALLPKPYGLGGIGIELGRTDDGRWPAGVDLDTCRDPETGQIEPWALAIVERLGSYVEVSPSRTGIKVFFLLDSADVPELRAAMGTQHGKQFKRGGGEHPPAIEMHISNRYFAVTGEHLAGTPGELRSVPLDVMLWLVRDAGPAFVRGRKNYASFAAMGAGQDNADLRARIERAAEKNPYLSQRWRGDWTGLLDDSRSGRAMALGSALRRAGFTFEELCQALRCHPDTAAWTREKGEANGARELRRVWDKAVESPPATARDDAPIRFSEDALADALAADIADDARFVADLGRGTWAFREGHVWSDNGLLAVRNRARTVCREAAAQARHEGGNRAGHLARSLSTNKAIAAVEQIARCAPALAATRTDFDADPWVINSPGGVVELRNGRLRPHGRGDMHMKATMVAPGGECRRWLDFLGQACRGSAEVIAYLQRWAGYALTGVTSEQALLFITGPGGNGKSLFINMLAAALGDYATPAAPDILQRPQNEQHLAHLAAIRGARLVTLTEVDSNKDWHEPRVKAITGGDEVAARGMHENLSKFKPICKLFVAGNQKPRIRNPGPAMTHRLHVVPFDYVPSVPDRTLPEALLAESPGILAWAIQGCLEWQRCGLKPPSVVVAAVDDYLAEQDQHGQWLAEACEHGSDFKELSGTLFKAWGDWAKQRNEPQGTTPEFAAAMRRLGFPSRHTNRGTAFEGVQLRQLEEQGTPAL